MTEAHDFNFCYAVPPKLENDRVKLIPFEPSTKHVTAFVEAARPYPEVYKYLAAVGPYDSNEEFLSTFYNPIVQKDQSYCLFLLIDKTKPASTTVGLDGEDGAVAGHLAFMNCSAPNLTLEIGYICILPPFQRTHVTSNAVGLMRQYALNLPDRGGLGLRRVFWQANELNKPSVRLAERLGYRFEGVLRWDRVLPPRKKQFGNGVTPRDGDPRGTDCAGRHTAMLSHCWDDWEDGGREKVEAEMARTS